MPLPLFRVGSQGAGWTVGTVERMDEFDREKGIAAGLRVQGRRQGPHLGTRRIQHIGQQRIEVIQGQAGQGQYRQGCPRGRQPADQTHERMSGIHGVVAVGAEQEQAVERRVVQQRGDEVQRGLVGPLQVVEEQDQGMAGCGDLAQQGDQQGPQTDLRLDGAERRHRWLGTEQRRQFRHRLEQRAGVRTQAGQHPLAPPGEGRLGFGQQRLAQLTQALGRGQKGAILLKLVELAAEEQTMGQGHRAVDLADQGRLADPGVTRHEEPPGAAGGNLGKGLQQGRQFPVAPVQAARRAG